MSAAADRGPLGPSRGPGHPAPARRGRRCRRGPVRTRLGEPVPVRAARSDPAGNNVRPRRRADHDRAGRGRDRVAAQRPGPLGRGSTGPRAGPPAGRAPRQADDASDGTADPADGTHGDGAGGGGGANGPPAGADGGDGRAGRRAVSDPRRARARAATSAPGMAGPALRSAVPRTRTHTAALHAPPARLAEAERPATRRGLSTRGRARSTARYRDLNSPSWTTETSSCPSMS